MQNARISRHSIIRFASAAATLMLVFSAGCQQLTGTELRSILANSATTTTVTTVNTAFTSSIGAIVNNVLGDIFKALFGVM
jgi:hypothetical protein